MKGSVLDAGGQAPGGNHLSAGDGGAIPARLVGRALGAARCGFAKCGGGGDRTRAGVWLHSVSILGMEEMMTGREMMRVRAP